MNEPDHSQVFTDACSRGHRLFGLVKYCPFCGLVVVQTVAEMKVENVATSQLTLQPEVKAAAAKSVRAVQPSIPEPINVPTPQLEQPIQPVTEPLSQITEPQSAKVSPNAEPVIHLQPSPILLTKNKKYFSIWGGGAAGLVVLLILFEMFKTAAPERSVPEVTKPVTDDQPRVQTQKSHKKSFPKKVPEPIPAPKQLDAMPVVIPNSAPPKQKAKPRENEKAIELLGEARKYIAQGNYRGAEDVMRFCGMIDSENQDCQQLKQKAARLNNQMFDCVSAGKEWVDGICK